MLPLPTSAIINTSKSEVKLVGSDRKTFQGTPYCRLGWPGYEMVCVSSFLVENKKGGYGPIFVANGIEI